MPKILFYYSAIASFLITASVVASSRTIGPFVFILLFLPVTAYFITEFFNVLRGRADLAINLKKGEGIVIFLVFLLLLGLGIANVALTNKTPPSSPLIFKTEQEAVPEEP